LAALRVAVVGCGAMGAATGWRLASRGVQVVCFDRHSPPHALGSSHGESRIIRTAYFEGAWYVPLVQEAFPLWRELEGDSGTRLLTMTGALMIGPPSAEAVLGAQDAAKARGLDARMLDAEELRRRYPAHVITAGDVAILDPQAGFIRPEDAVSAMIDRLVALGGEIRRGVVVKEVIGRAEGVEVATDEAHESFDAVVIAAGPWTQDLYPLPLAVERQVMAWFEIAAQGGDWLTPERFPVFIREADGLGIYGVPTLDGASLKIARHHGGERTDPETIEREVSGAELDPLRTFVTAHLRGVTDRVTKTAVCMYTNTPDEDFVIDLHPDDPRVVVISACSGHGFKFAPVVGDIAADLVSEGRTARDISRFSVARFAKSVS
jgi:sarcosine oxidase